MLKFSRLVKEQRERKKVRQIASFLFFFFFLNDSSWESYDINIQSHASLIMTSLFSLLFSSSSYVGDEMLNEFVQFWITHLSIASLMDKIMKKGKEEEILRSLFDRIRDNLRLKSPRKCTFLLFPSLVLCFSHRTTIR